MRTMLVLCAFASSLFITPVFADKEIMDKEPLIKTLFKELASGDRDKRLNAARELSRSTYRNNIEVIAPLAKAIENDDNALVREYAANGLAAHRNEMGQAKLIELSANKEMKGYAQIIRGMAGVERAIFVGPLLEAAKSKNKDAELAAVRGLSRHHRNQDIVFDELIIRMNTSSSSLTREYAADGIIASKRKDAITFLAATLNDPKSLGHEEAMGALADTDDTRALPLIRKGLKSKSRDLLMVTARAARNFVGANESLVDDLLEAYDTTSNSLTREYMAEGILGAPASNKKSLEFARKSLNSKQTSIRRDAIEFVTKAGDMSSLPVLADLLLSKDNSDRQRGLESIQSILKGKVSAKQMQEIMVCLPKTSSHPYSKGTKDVALLLDIFGFMGLMSTAAHKGRRIEVAEIQPEIVEALKILFKALPEVENAHLGERAG